MLLKFLLHIAWFVYVEFELFESEVISSIMQGFSSSSHSHYQCDSY